MTDPLGQSQVLPYLVGLSAQGWSITLISAEKPERSENTAIIQKICTDANIDWQPCSYAKNPPVLAPLKNVRRLKKLAFKLHQEKTFDIIHCRSYLSALIGLEMQSRFNTKFLFDMRGFWADERIDGGIWKLNNPVFKWAYSFFKKKEIEFLQKADYTVSLTHKGQEVIKNSICPTSSPIAIIPCCADTDHFSQANVDSSRVEVLKNELSLSDDDKVMAYIGSLGSWYMLTEMLEFFKVLLAQRPTFKFLFLTLDNPDMVISECHRLEIDTSRLIIKSSSRQDLPNYMCLIDCSIFFIKPAFSKQASSPTKMGELMSMGIPIIANDGVGDSTSLIQKYEVGEVVDLHNKKSFEDVVSRFDKLLSLNSSKIREGALDYFSLDSGIEKYTQIYKQLAGER